jgi:hypothetical protein
LDIKIKDDFGSINKEPKNKYIIIAIGSPGLKVTNRDQRLIDKWNIRKNYLKIHIAGEIYRAKKVLCCMIYQKNEYYYSKYIKYYYAGLYYDPYSVGFSSGWYTGSVILDIIATISQLI